MVLAAARVIAREQDKSLGAVVSELARRGLAPRPLMIYDDLVVFDVDPGARRSPPTWSLTRSTSRDGAARCQRARRAGVAESCPPHRRDLVVSEHHRSGWATCGPTESGFVRVSSNPRAIPGARPPGEAIELLGKLRLRDGFDFWPDDVTLTDLPEVRVDRVVGHRQVSDACRTRFGCPARRSTVDLRPGHQLVGPVGDRRRVVVVVTDEVPQTPSVVVR